MPYDQAPITGALHTLRPLRIEVLDERHPDLALFRLLLQRYHYLGLRNSVGENLKYLARDRHGHPLPCLLFGSAAWKAKARDRFIGWDATGRQQRLTRLTNNTRFLILPFPVKDIYWLPLTRDFRRRLGAPAGSRADGRAGR